MPDDSDLAAFALSEFERLDPERDAAAVATLTGRMEGLVVSRLSESPGIEGIQLLVEALNRLGHGFERRETNPGWTSWVQHTNDGTREFWIHVERDEELDTVMVLYQETLEATVARRRAGLSEEERADEGRVESFYDRGLALSDRYDGYPELPEKDRLLLCLYLLDTGVGNGGFHTWVINTQGELLRDARTFLARIGAPELAAVVGEVIALLPSSVTSRESWGAELDQAAYDALERGSARLDALDGRFYDAEESIARLAMRYLEDERP